MNLRHLVSLPVLGALFCLTACHPSGPGGGAISADGDSEIFGGKVVQNGDPVATLPITHYVIGVQYKNADGSVTSCGGTLIAPRVVLTAAHCLPAKISDLRVYFTTNLQTAASLPANMVRHVVNWVIPDAYKKVAAKDWNPNDIALLKLDQADPAFARNMLLPGAAFDESQIPQMAVAGFGVSNAIGSNENTQKEEGFDLILKRAIVNLEPVNEAITGFIQIRQSDDSGTGICSGDSGSPLYVQADNGYVVYGVISAFENPKDANLPCRGFARAVDISLWKTWIMQNGFMLSQIVK